MNRRTLTTAMLAFLAVLFTPQIGLSQTHPLIGTWKLNLEKSKFNPGPPQKSQTVIFEAVGQGLRATVDIMDAQGTTRKLAFGPWFYDGNSYPITGSPAYDAATYKQLNNSTAESTRTKAGKVVQTATSVTSSDGKTYTLTTTGVDENGQQISNLFVYDKQ